MTTKLEHVVALSDLGGPPINRRMKENQIEHDLARRAGVEMLQRGKLRMRQEQHGAVVVYSMEIKED